MKVLLSAAACNPYIGSEHHFGWAAIKCLARDHELCVITAERDRSYITQAQAEGWAPDNVQFVYVGNPKAWHPNRLLARVQSWNEYAQFASSLGAVASRLHQEKQFDIAHHVTFSTWRVSSPLWQLGIPFVYGPLAGNEPFPFRLFPILSPIGKAFELARNTSNLVSRYVPGVRKSIRKAAHIFAITEESETLMKSIRGHGQGISRLSPGFFSEAKCAEFLRFVPTKSSSGILRLYAAGNLGGQKCIAIALRALSRAKKRGVSFRYLLGSGGPEVPHLRKLVAKLELTDDVVFGNGTSRQEYQEILGRTHLYLLPSMRETVGVTMLEAMLAGCVPIVGDNGGPRFAVTDDCGYKIRASTPQQMAEEIADIIVSIDQDRKILAEKGPLASRRIAETFTEENYRNSVNAVYNAVLAVRPS